MTALELQGRFDDACDSDDVMRIADIAIKRCDALERVIRDLLGMPAEDDPFRSLYCISLKLGIRLRELGF